MMKSLKCEKAVKDNLGRINSLDFSANGEAVITSSDDSVVQLQSLNRDKYSPRHLLCKKYGTGMVRFVRGGPKKCIIASRIPNEASIRLWDLTENKFTKTFTLPLPSKRTVYTFIPNKICSQSRVLIEEFEFIASTKIDVR